MSSETIFNLSIVMKDHLDNHREEDIVKNLWPSLTAFMTTRHGITKGKVILGDNEAIILNWEYKYPDYEYEDPSYENYYIKDDFE